MHVHTSGVIGHLTSAVQYCFVNRAKFCVFKNRHTYATYLDWRISPHANCRNHSCKRYFLAAYYIQNLLHKKYSIPLAENCIWTTSVKHFWLHSENAKRFCNLAYFKYKTQNTLYVFQIVYHTGRHRASGGPFLTPYTWSAAIQPICRTSRLTAVRSIIDFSLFDLGGLPLSQSSSKGEMTYAIHLGLPSYKF